MDLSGSPTEPVVQPMGRRRLPIPGMHDRHCTYLDVLTQTSLDRHQRTGRECNHSLAGDTFEQRGSSGQI